MPHSATDDARAELATAALTALRDRWGPELSGPDVIALAMLAIGGGPLTPASLVTRLRKLGCAPALLRQLDALIVDALEADVVRYAAGRLHGRVREIRSRVSRVLAHRSASRLVEPPRAAVEAKTAPAAAPTPALSIPTPFHPSAVELGALDLDVATTALAAPAQPWDVVLHTLTAHALAAAEQFDELLSLPTLRGVDSHRYQLETVRRVLRAFRGRALLADEVGLGKTIEAIMVLREYQLRGMASRILVLVPPALVHHWVGELSYKAGVDCASTADALVRSDPERFWAQGGLVVASLGTARMARHARLVQATPWDLVIVDEAHHVKRRTTLGWKLVDGLHTRFLLLLTATPIENDLDEIYSLVTLLRPGHFATAATFRAQFVDTKNPTSPRNRERLRGLLSEIMIRNTRASCGLALPPRFVTTMLVEPLPAERALYEQVLAFLRERGGTPGVRMLANVLLLGAGSSPAAVAATLARVSARDGHDAKARDAIRGLAEVSAKVAESRKRTALLEIMAQHPDEQVLVFTRYRASVGFLGQALREAGIDHVVFDGQLSPRERAAVLEAFAGGTRVLLATDVGSEGQNLQHCHVLVNFDLPWNPMVIEQRIGRLHRMGQTSEVRVYNLAARGTIEDRVLEVLDRRLHLFELVVGEMDMVLGNLADDRDLEERILDMVAQASDERALDEGFTALEQELRAARTRYDHTKALDEALFGEDFES